MHRPILFRGGMVGDLVLGMIDKTALIKGSIRDQDSNCNEYRIKHSRSQMKKFFNYTELKKEEYFKRLDNTKRVCYTLTHDTNFALTKNPVQIICTDLTKLEWISTRFKEIHQDHVIQRVIKDIKSNSNSFIIDYANDIQNWQTYYKCNNRFDIKNIGTAQFLDDVCNYFNITDTTWATQIYQTWRQNESNRSK